MAKVVLIAEGTVRPGINAVGDVVSIHDDKTTLTGPGYANLTVLHIPDMTKEQVRESLAKIRPEEANAFQTQTGVGVWSLDRPEEKKVWKNHDGKWCFLEEDPKYRFTFADVTPQALASLSEATGTGVAKGLLLEGQCKEKIVLNEKNHVEVKDLNQ